MSFSPEHPIISFNPNLFESAVDTFGEDQAGLLIGSIIDSYDIAHDYLPVLSQIKQVQVTVQENVTGRPVQGKAQLKTGVLKLGINNTSSISEIIPELPDVVIHETAHLAHVQRNPRFFDERREAASLHFGSAILEGVAVKAGRDFGAFSVYGVEMFRQPKVFDALRQLVENPDPDQYATYEDFIKGTPNFRNKGYRIGELVVTEIAIAKTLGLSSIMELPLIDFRNFANELA